MREKRRQLNERLRQKQSSADENMHMKVARTNPHRKDG